MRIEDLDQGRSREDFVDGIIEDMEWLGLEGDGDVVTQSERTEAYANSLERLKSKGLVYPCFCTRADIAAATAPHNNDEPHYPGTCRGLAEDPDRRAKEPHSWRLNAAKALEQTGLPSWREHDGRTFDSNRDNFDDVILARKDAASAYHLACVIDDAYQGVDLVVRGEDLRSSTPVQRLLQRLLDLPEPTFLHHPLVLHNDGRRLAKRDHAPTLAAMREAGVGGKALARELESRRLPLGFRLSSA